MEHRRRVRFKGDQFVEFADQERGTAGITYLYQTEADPDLRECEVLLDNKYMYINPPGVCM